MTHFHLGHYFYDKVHVSKNQQIHGHISHIIQVFSDKAHGLQIHIDLSVRIF